MSGRRQIGLISDGLEPVSSVMVTAGHDYGDVHREGIGGRTVPVVCPGRARDGIACSRPDNGAIAHANESYPFEDMECLAVGVDVPVGVRSWCEMDDGGGRGVGSSIWLRQREPGETGLYLGVVCGSNQAVDAAYAAAIKAGAIDEGAPADRTYFAPGYYAANVADFDGNRLEFVHKAWNPQRLP
jgi:hypothetical protein